MVISTEVERAKSYWHFDLPGEMSIPVAQPRLPTTDEIAPYLRRIDASRWYSNGGPLVQEFGIIGSAAVYGGVSGYLNLSRRGDAASHSEND